MRHPFLTLTLATALVCGERVSAQSVANGPARADVVVLHNGVNDVPLLGDTTPGQVVVMWRGNFNAHGYSVVAFAVRNRSDLNDHDMLWQSVPFFGGPQDGDIGREIFRTSEGADCTLADLRIVRHAGKPVEVIIAARGLGKSFADPAPVHFDYYRVERNRDQAAGSPPTYFQFVRRVPARRQYCDVNAAFNDELHLTRAGLGHGEQNNK